MPGAAVLATAADAAGLVTIHTVALDCTMDSDATELLTELAARHHGRCTLVDESSLARLVLAEASVPYAFDGHDIQVS